MNITVTAPRITVKVGNESATASIGTPVVKEYFERPAYDGAYEVTPSDEVQTLLTANLRMTDNITVNPIPSNYGRITWNGSVMTVS